MLQSSRRTRLFLFILLAAAAVSLACEGSGASVSQGAEPVHVKTLEVQAGQRGALVLPGVPGSVRFAVIGDSGRGSRQQYEVAAQIEAYRARFPFKLVLMVGDNIYEGPATPRDYEEKFEQPYKALLDADVTFQAVLGNHDDPAQRFYAPFHMGGSRYYTFKDEGVRGLLAGGVRFFAIDSTYLDTEQLEWLDRELEQSGSDWKICFLHHPLYTSGRYSFSSRAIRYALEPLFIRRGVTVVFSGHEHVYERLVPQNGVMYFISGSAGSIRVGDLNASEMMASGYDKDFSFMLVEIVGDDLYFQAISRTGETVDAGTFRRQTSSE